MSECEVEKIYEYRTSSFSDKTSGTLICQGRKLFIEKFIRQGEVHDTFGGFILSQGIISDEEFLGVWGKRNCQKFRRILRERGANFELLKNMPPPVVYPG